MKKTVRIISGIALFLGVLVFALFKYPAAAVAMLVSTDGYTNQENLVYGNQPRQRYDLYVPENVQPDAPLLVFFYGGGWSMGNKALYRFVGQTFASRGIIVAIPDYNLYPEVIFPAFMEDGAMAVTKIEADVRARYGAAHKLFLAGHSAGAHIAVLLALDKSYLKAQTFDQSKIAGVVGLSGPYDFLPLTEDKYKAIFPENVRDASQPINFVSGKMPPMLLLTGDSDTTVQPRNTENLAKKINASGGRAETQYYPDVNHFGTILALYENWPGTSPPVRDAMLAFFKAHAK